MTLIILVNDTNPAHLEMVKAEMMVLGSPTIRAIDGGDCLIAIEGSHRLRAAEELGLMVKVEIIDEDGEIDLDTLDWDDYGWFSERIVPALEFIDVFTRSPFPMRSPTVELDVIR